MDIFKYNEKMNKAEADYYDMHTGYTYHLADYNRQRRLGLPELPLKVSKDGVLIGYVREEN